MDEALTGSGGRRDAIPGGDAEVLAALHRLLADARRQQTVLRDSLATVTSFLERPLQG